MRIIITTTPNNKIIPFEYQQLLTGAIHKWLGSNNEEHDALSLYSFSWLKNGRAEKAGINFMYGATFFISSFDEGIIKKIITGIQNDPTMFCGMAVRELTIQQTPQFGNEASFSLASPVFIKRRLDDRIKFYYHDDDESDTFMTETLVKKLNEAGIDSKNVQVAFDKNYRNPSRKGTTYKGVKSIGSICPVIIKGTPEQIAFAWNVGLGNSTGIGFGALV